VLGVRVELEDEAVYVFAVNGRGDDGPAAKAPLGLRPLFTPVPPRPRPRPAGDGVFGWLWSKFALLRTEKRAGVPDWGRFGVYDGCPLLVVP
jgi:hypothetical protein